MQDECEEANPEGGTMGFVPLLLPPTPALLTHTCRISPLFYADANFPALLCPPFNLTQTYRPLYLVQISPHKMYMQSLYGRYVYGDTSIEAHTDNSLRLSVESSWGPISGKDFGYFSLITTPHPQVNKSLGIYSLALSLGWQFS